MFKLKPGPMVMPKTVYYFPPIGGLTFDVSHIVDSTASAKKFSTQN